LDSRREEQVLPRVVGTNGRGEVVGKGVGGWVWCNNVYTCM
jgi:hypothetical protein